MGAIERVFRGRRGGQERPAAAIVAGLWRNGEQGVWYDPSDLSTMFQDATGTTPVYMPGQGQPDCWIGLQLDKRFGLLRGTERITNGDFSAGLASWTAGAGVTESTGAVQFTGVASGVGITQAAATPYVAGAWYRVTLTIADCVGGPVLAVRLGGAGAFFTVTAGAGPKTLTIQAGGPSTSAVFVAVSSGGATYKIDDISVRELPGNHRWQGTATSRPVLSARYNLLTKTEDFSVAAAWPTEATGTGSAPVCTARYATAPDGTLTATRLQLSLNGGTAAADRSGVAQTVAAVTQAASYKGVIWLKATTPADIGKTVLLRHVGGTNYYPCVLTANWKAFERVEAAATSYGVFVLGLRGASGGASDSVDILVWGADLRAVTDGVGLPPYQRVVDPNTYDTVGFPLYRKPDGVDDWMQTANVDFSGTDKVFAAVALRKISDAAAGIVAELSSVSNTNNGAFTILAPAAATSSAGAYLRGDSALVVSLYSVLPSPVSVTLTAIFDLAAPAGSENKFFTNGIFRHASGSEAGGGNFGSYPMYFDRRGGTALPFGGREYCTIIVGRLLTAFETAAVEKYLRQKSRAY